MKRKTKQTLKTILLSALGIGAIVGVASGINALVEKSDEELKVIHPVFEIGGLDSNGQHEESDGTIYTKTAFECQGLEIKLDFDSHIEYEVFYYKSNGNFLESTGVLENGYTAVVPEMATHARIEITPEWDELGDDYAKEDDQVIKWYEVNKYSSQMEVKVAIDQTVERQNLFAVDSSMNGKQYASNYATSTLEGYYNTKLIDVSSAEKVTIVIPPKYASTLQKYALFGFDSAGTYVYTNFSSLTDGTNCVKTTNKDGSVTFEFTDFIANYEKIGMQLSGLEYVCEIYID